MKIRLSQFLVVATCLATTSIIAQPAGRGGGMGAPPRTPKFTGSMAALFGNYPGFSATTETQAPLAGDEKMTVPGKVAVADNKSRFEVDMTQARGTALPAGAAAQMKAMGMDQMVIITRPDKKVQYMVYPGLKAYLEQPLTDPEATKSKDNFTITTTPITRETVEGHDCEKNKVEITDKEGNKQVVTVWNARDLSKFPVKFEQTENGSLTTVTFKDVKLVKPEASQFDVPADFTKYDNYSELIRKEMMKKYPGVSPGGAPRPPQR